MTRALGLRYRGFDVQMIETDKRLLDVKGLAVELRTERGAIKAVDGADLCICPGETLGLVGESGSGKTMTSLAIMSLLPKPQGRIAAGKICFKGKNLANLSDKEMRRIRGKEIAMIFQEPMTSLNPVYTIGDQIVEAIISHCKITRRRAMDLAVEMLQKVGIPSPESRVSAYPHELSGGMRQRAMIAMALSCDPDLLIADEPTTALDVTIQAQILDLMKELKRKIGMSLLLITHALGIVAEMADRVCVMYAGRIVESANTKDLFKSPLHPYTLGLLKSIPRLDEEAEELYAIPGMVPTPQETPSGCKFYDRCFLRYGRCGVEEPLLDDVESMHWVRCFRHDEMAKMRGDTSDGRRSFA